MRTYFIILMIFIVSCFSSAKNESNKDVNSKKVAIITKDSCLKWNLPVTHFQIKFPDTYIALFNSKNNYVSLTKKGDRGYILQEFSFGKSENIQTDKDIQEWTYIADSLLNSLNVYHRKFIGYKTLADKSYFLASGIVNFDSFGAAEYKGDYNILMTLIPTNKQPNGISISIMTKADKDTTNLYKEANAILSSLEFLKD